MDIKLICTKAFSGCTLIKISITEKSKANSVLNN